MRVMSAPGQAHSAITAWLELFGACVRDVDYAAARKLFSPDVFAFGSRTLALDGQRQLEREQWGAVWPHTRDFRFELETLRYELTESSCALFVLWSSTGIPRTGTPFPRSGRATILLSRPLMGFEPLLATHTHFSLNPEP